MTDDDNARIRRETGAGGYFDTENQQQQISDMMNGPGGLVAALAVISLIIGFFIFAGWQFALVVVGLGALALAGYLFLGGGNDG